MSSGKTKVIFLINSLAGGGAEKIMTTLLHNIDRDRFDVSLCLTCEYRVDYDLDESIPLHIPNFDEVKITALLTAVITTLSLARCLIPVAGLSHMHTKYVNVSAQLTTLCRSYFATRKYVESVKPNILVSFLFISSLIAIVLKIQSRGRLRVACSDHCTLTKELKNFFPLMYIHLPRFLFRHLDAYVAVSKGVQQDLVRNYHVSREHIRVIYNGTDIDAIKSLVLKPVSLEIARLLPDDGAFSIVNVGRLAPPKNQAVLLKAFQIVRRHCNCRLYLIGQGELLAELTDLASELGIAQDVFFLGWQENPFNIMARCDLFVLSSSWEAFPNVLVEAMAIGLPIVSTDCPTGPGEALAGGEYGDLVPVNDAGALANALIRMHDDEIRRNRFAQMGAKRAESFSLCHMISGYEHILDELGADCPGHSLQGGAE